ncbi:hypothetical protein BT96DRAFT_1006195 [Gymnopus androsaceus JB14]|uniref:Uncharacterized protein n=1 Tax=Gymnopus androsaceus JB14 TaxID=1447944 RepID=A0A6A4GM32_9AGAR|nr:hypothetical protein BT96DRAFT_1006195 [Gymnopus androsaceus JB14]
MSTSSIVDYHDVLTEKCMGCASLENDELTDDEEGEEETCGPVATLADLDPAHFAQVLANVMGPVLEEGEIWEPPSPRSRVQPYTKFPHPAQKQLGIDRKTKRLIRGIKREASKQIREAIKHENTVVIPGFLFEVAVGQNQYARLCMLDSRKKPSSTTEWLDGKHAWRAVSQDVYDLVVHIPDAIKEESKTIFTDLLVDYGNSINLLPTTTADHFHRNNPNSYEFREGEVSGVKHFVKCWHAIGHTTSEPVISGDSAIAAILTA